LFNINEFKKNFKDPIFILGTGSTINELSYREKKYIEKSTSIGINWFCISDLNPKFLAMEAPKKKWALDLYIKLLKDKNTRFKGNRSSLLLHDSFVKKKDYDLKKILKHFKSVQVYSTAFIKCVNDRKLDDIYKYLYKPCVLRFLHSNMIYGIHSTVDRLTHLAISSGFKEIIYSGVDLKDSRYFWEEKKFKNQFKNELLALTQRNNKKPHTIEYKREQISASQIIRSNYKYASSKGIKFYTTSKKSKLYSFLPLYEFKNDND
jgi:hypothetical protein